MSSVDLPDEPDKSLSSNSASPCPSPVKQTSVSNLRFLFLKRISFCVYALGVRVGRMSSVELPDEPDKSLGASPSRVKQTSVCDWIFIFKTYYLLESIILRDKMR